MKIYTSSFTKCMQKRIIVTSCLHLYSLPLQTPMVTYAYEIIVCYTREFSNSLSHHEYSNMTGIEVEEKHSQLHTISTVEEGLYVIE